MRFSLIPVAILMLGAIAVPLACGDDLEIAREITERLRREQEQGNLRSFDINIRVNEGKVSLKGRVSSAEHRELTEEVAAQVDGVKEVDNQLVVKGPDDSEPVDDELPPPVDGEEEESRSTARKVFDVLRGILDILAWIGRRLIP